MPSSSRPSAFTAPRNATRWAWTYRIRPGVPHQPFREIDPRLLRSGPFLDVPTPPNQLRWSPLRMPAEDTDFVQGIVTMGGNGDPAAAVRHGDPFVRGQRFHAGRFFYTRTARC